MQGEVTFRPGLRDKSGKRVPLDVKNGHRVLFGKWSGTEVKIDGEELADNERKRYLRSHQGKSVRARRG